MLLKNKRPIYLLDIVYKLIAKVLSNRLSKVICSIINRDQTGFLKNRYIGENIRQVADVIDYCKMDNINGILLAIDYSSAFDCLEHDFLMQTLKTFNFGENFQSWIRLLYKDAFLSIKNNGYTSQWFPCTRGSFQGCYSSGIHRRWETGQRDKIHAGPQASLLPLLSRSEPHWPHRRGFKASSVL